MTGHVSQPRGELELVRRFRALLANPASTTPSGVVGFGDDMCSVSPDDPRLLWTVDMLMDGVDFDSRVHAWSAIGRKAMAVNLSDCAAMAAVPVSAVCAVALSNKLSLDDATALLRGAHEFGVQHGCPIAGGDTNSWDAATVVSITIAARCESGQTPVRRDGARPGDGIWLTGPVGGSILGRHMTFEPRLSLSRNIARKLQPHAMIDISDGLALDLWRILEASGCGAAMDEAALDAAIHPDAVRLAAQDGSTARDHTLYDGEDFELIVVTPPAVDAKACADLGLLPLGQMTAEPGLMLARSDGSRKPLEVRGWEHFR